VPCKKLIGGKELKRKVGAKEELGQCKGRAGPGTIKELKGLMINLVLSFCTGQLPFTCDLGRAGPGTARCKGRAGPGTAKELSQKYLMEMERKYFGFLILLEYQIKYFHFLLHQHYLYYHEKIIPLFFGLHNFFCMLNGRIKKGTESCTKMSIFLSTKHVAKLMYIATESLTKRTRSKEGVLSATHLREYLISNPCLF